MKWLGKIDRQTYLIVLAPLAISLLASLVASVVTRSSEYFIFIIVTFFLLSFFGIVISFQAGRLAERVESLLDRRLPEIRHVMGDETMLHWELLNTVRQAKSFIAATGGKARTLEYLQAIEEKVINEGLRYTRVIPGDPVINPDFAIRHELCEHLRRLLSNRRSSQLTTIIRTDYSSVGYYLATDAGFIIFMPNPRPRAPFDTCISMPNRPDVSDRYREYIVEVLGGFGARTGREVITSENRVKELCQHCRRQA